MAIALKIDKLMMILLLTLLIVGCSNGTVNSDEIKGNTSRVSMTDHANRELIIEEVPVRIVSLVQGDMEIIHKLGAKIVGRPTVSGHLIAEELVGIEEVGTAHDVDFEKVVSLKPDLIIGHAGLNMKDVSTVEALGLKLFLTNSNSYERIIEVIGLYGEILDREDEANEMIAEIEQKKSLIQANPLTQKVKALIVYGTTDLFMAALPTSLSGNLLDITGGENIASNLPGIDNYPDYAQLSMERIIEANPDVIYFITHGDPDAVKEKFKLELKSNPAWNNVKAFEHDNFVFLPYELFGTNPGPKIADSLSYLMESLESVAAKK